MEDYDFFYNYLPASILMILVGFGIKVYLRKIGKNTDRYSFSVFGLKYISNAFIIFGSIALFFALIAAFLVLRYEDII
jgi:hypothetical protein